MVAGRRHGHMPHPLAVVMYSEMDVFLAGDAPYSQDALLAGQVDAISPNEAHARDTVS